MEYKPLQHIKELQQKVSDLEKTKSRLEFQIQELITKSAQRSAEVDQRNTELEIIIRNLQCEIGDMKKERREMRRKFEEVTPAAAEVSEVIDLDCNEVDENLQFESIPIQASSNYGIRQARPFACNICSKTYIHKKRLEIHLKTHQKSTESQLGPNKSFICNVKNCGFTTEHFPAIQRHKKAHAGKTLNCDFYNCDYKTPYRKRYISHMAHKHGANIKDGSFEDENDGSNQFSIVTDFNLI